MTEHYKRRNHFARKKLKTTQNECPTPKYEKYQVRLGIFTQDSLQVSRDPWGTYLPILREIEQDFFFANFEARRAAHPVLHFFSGHIQEERFKFLDFPSLEEYSHQINLNWSCFDPLKRVKNTQFFTFLPTFLSMSCAPGNLGIFTFSANFIGHI